MPYRQKKIFSGTASIEMTDRICERLSIRRSVGLKTKFPDGEINPQLQENVRGMDVFIVNSTHPNGDNILETVLLGNAAKNSSAGRVTLVILYLGYNRGDRKDRPRVPVAAKVIIDVLKVSRADRVLLLDIHSEPTAPHFEPAIVDHLYASYVTIPHLKKILDRPYVVASPDKGGGPRADAYANHLNQQEVAYFQKRRPKPGVVDKGSIRIVGDVKGKDVLFVDDMIDSGGTLIAVAEAAKKAGAKRIFASATHALLSGDAIKNLAKSPFTEIVITDTIPHDPKLLKAGKVKITVMPVAPFIAEAIRRIHEDESLSPLILG